MYPYPIDVLKRQHSAAKRLNRAIQNRIKLEPGMRQSFENAERKMSEMQGSSDEANEEEVQRNVDILMKSNPHKVEYDNALKEYIMAFT